MAGGGGYRAVVVCIIEEGSERVRVRVRVRVRERERRDEVWESDGNGNPG